jgi:hypothetical protein
MASDSGGDPGLDPRPEGTFLFPSVDAGGPLEELEAQAERKLRMYATVGDRENAERLSRALDLARTHLAARIARPGRGAC